MNINHFFAFLIIAFLSAGLGSISNFASANNDPLLKGIGSPSQTFAQNGDTYVDVCTESYYSKNVMWSTVSSISNPTALNLPPSNLPADEVIRNVIDAHGHVCAQGTTSKTTPIASAGVLYSQGVSTSTYHPTQTHLSINSVTRSQSMSGVQGTISMHNYTNSQNTTNPQGGIIGSPIYSQANTALTLYGCSPSVTNSKDYFCAQSIDKSSGYLCTKDVNNPLAFFCSKSEKNEQGGLLSTQNYPVQASTGLTVYPCKVSIIGSAGYFCADNINNFQGKALGSSIYYR